jgi:hypothetical protein
MNRTNESGKNKDYYKEKYGAGGWYYGTSSGARSLADLERRGMNRETLALLADGSAGSAAGSASSSAGVAGRPGGEGGSRHECGAGHLRSRLRPPMSKESWDEL